MSELKLIDTILEDVDLTKLGEAARKKRRTMLIDEKEFFLDINFEIGRAWEWCEKGGKGMSKPNEVCVGFLVPVHGFGHECVIIPLKKLLKRQMERECDTTEDEQILRYIEDAEFLQAQLSRNISNAKKMLHGASETPSATS